MMVSSPSFFAAATRSLIASAMAAQLVVRSAIADTELIAVGSNHARFMLSLLQESQSLGLRARRFVVDLPSVRRQPRQCPSPYLFLDRCPTHRNANTRPVALQSTSL